MSNQNVNLDGTLEEVLCQLSYIISFVFVRMVMQGYGIKQIKVIFDKVMKDGFNRGIDSLENEVKQNESRQQGQFNEQIQQADSG